MDMAGIPILAVGISMFRFRKYRKTVFKLMDLNMSPTLKHFMQAKTVNTEKKIIISTIQCKKNEILPQASNDKTANIREHTCQAKWDGLQSRNTL